MSSKDYKSLKNLIEKLASPPPPPPPGAGGLAPTPSRVPAPGGSPAPVGHGVVGGGLPAVRQMQVAMQELAAAVMRDAESATMGRKPMDQVMTPAEGNQKNSKKAFNDFIAEQYVGTLDKSKKGVEWSDNKNTTSFGNKAKSQTDIYELDAVMNTLKRIGQPKSELQADGRWDFRTDNALHNMLGFAYALLQLEGDFGLENPKFTHKDLNRFQALLSGYNTGEGKIELTDAEKNKRAPQITQYLENIEDLYTDFRLQVTARPEFRPYIEGDREFESYNNKNSNPDVLTPQDTAVIPSGKITGLSLKPMNSKTPVTEIPLSALENQKSFDDFVSDTLGYSDTEKYSPLFLNLIKKHLATSA